VIARIAPLVGVEVDSGAARRVRELEQQIYAVENMMDPLTRLVTGTTLEAQQQDLADLQRALEAAKQKAAQEGAGAVADTLRTALNAGVDTLSQRVAEVTGTLNERLSPQFEVETNIADVRERFDDLYDGIIDQSSAVTGAMREFEMAVASVVDPLNMTEEEIKRIEEAQRKVNNEIDKEQGAREKAQQDAAQLAAEDQKRVESLLQTNDQLQRVQEDILAVSREQSRIQKEIDAARSEGDIQAANEAVARLAQLDQLQARLEDQQQAIEQGFGQGFQAAFDAVTKDVNGLINKAAEFGNEGALAAQRLQEGIAAAQEQARDGILNAEAFNAEVQRQQQLFEQEIGRIEQLEQFRQQMREQAIEAEQQRQEEIAAAQEKAEEEREQIRQSIIQAEQAFLEEQRKAQEAEAQRQAERIRQLNTLGSGVVQAGDVRTAEGAALLQQLAAEAQDPALIEQRRQTKLLQQISLGIAGAAANYFDSPVEIVGFARTGGIP
jgi:chromosome segregation ATPase